MKISDTVVGAGFVAAGALIIRAWMEAIPGLRCSRAC
jgi:hypothetical protein